MYLKFTDYLNSYHLVHLKNYYQKHKEYFNETWSFTYYLLMKINIGELWDVYFMFILIAQHQSMADGLQVTFL